MLIKKNSLITNSIKVLIVIKLCFLQQQLEEAFFSAQPVSVRKTVEFVSERIASACVKYICHDLVPQFKQKSLEELEVLFKEYDETCDDSKEVSYF